MPNLPPPVWAELFYSGAWNTITDDVRVTTSAVSITRGLSSESASDAEPTSCECDLDSRDYKFAPRAPGSVLYGKIGRNTPMRLGYTVGSPWVALDGTDGNEITTPTNTAFNVTDLDLRIEIALDDWARQQNLAARFLATGDQRSWGLYLAGTGQLAFHWSATGTSTLITRFSTVPMTAYNGQRLALRVTLDVDNGAGGYELRFYTGRTVDDTEWTLLGDPIVGGATTAVFGAAAPIELGDMTGIALPAMIGKAYALKLLNGIGGTTVLRMTTQDASPGVTSFTSGGFVWTKATAGAVLTNRHIRMSGEVPAWPPTRDLSGNDNYVSVNPTGITRRMDAGNKPQDSALLRYIKAQGPIDCWPFTDGADATQAQSMTGGSPLRVSLDFGTTQPNWGAGALADWVEPTISLAAATDGVIAGPATLTDPGTTWSADLSFSGVTASGASIDYAVTDRAAGSDADPTGQWTVTVDKNANSITLRRASVGETSSSVTLLSTISSPGVFNDLPHHLRLTVDTSGATTPWQLYLDGTLKDSGTYAAPSKSPRRLRTGWFLNGVAQGTGTPTFGYLTYWGSTAPAASQTYSALVGFTGELAGVRIERLAAEAGYVASVAGDTALQEPMGIQGRKKLLELLGEANRTNFGYLLDARDRNEVIHRGHSTLWNQPPALTLDFQAGLISAPFKPVDDDKLTENDVSVKREYGSVPARQILETGELSVQDFPDGVGRYDNEYTYSLATDDQAGHVASMRLHLGTYNGVRYARITLNLANSRVFAMIDDILRVDCGDLVRLTNLPADHGPDAVNVLVQGYTETAGPDEWTITFNCVPGEPWTALVLGSTTYSRLDTGGCVLAAGLTAVQTSVGVTTTGTRRWVDSATYPAEFPFDVRVGGEVMRVTACTGTTASQTFTVTRSVNGVSTTHDSGADVRLATPVYLAL